MKYINVLLIFFFFIINIILIQYLIKINNTKKIKYEFFMSPVAGVGVRAIDNIKKGEIIAKEPYIIINGDEKSLEHYKWLISGKYLLINGVGNFANHSDNNNIKIISNKSFCKSDGNNKNFIFFKALKDIKKGEELFNNYGTPDWFESRKIQKK